MHSGSTFNVTLKNTTDYGQLHLTHDGNSFANGNIVHVTLASGATISNGNQFLVIRSDGTITTATPTVTCSDSNLIFDPSWGILDALYGLILTAEIEAQQIKTTYAGQATSGNSRAAGVALDNAKVQGASGDMLIVLDTLDGLSSSQVAASLNTLVPVVDRSVLDTSTVSLNNFISTSLERLENVLTFAANPDSAKSGVSSGDQNKLNGIWAKGYGSYLTQDTRKGILGYDAWNAGTAVGLDHLFGDTLTFGISGGYAYGNVDSSDTNNANTYINSAQTTIYAGYQDANHTYFIDAAGSFAWNWYNGRRDISVGSISRTANADYDGQQYAAYLGGGYKFKLGKSLEFTPLASIQWNHLHLADYTETEAGALNLTVNRQSYNILQPNELEYGKAFPWGNAHNYHKQTI